MKKIDLNIEKILENWDTKHPVREIIANALDYKLNNNDIIGKFEIGLSDALGTFERKSVGVKILSKYENITFGKLTN